MGQILFIKGEIIKRKGKKDVKEKPTEEDEFVISIGHVNIKLIHQLIAEKNQAFMEKKELITREIENVRKKISKTVTGLNSRVSDRIQKKVKILMNKDSRPQEQNMNELMSLYSYMEKQDSIISNNHNRIQKLWIQCQSTEVNLRNKESIRPVLTELDEEYEQLKKKCEKEEKSRRELLEERDQKRGHYFNINQSIDQYRKEYELVEQQIRTRERELIQVVSYYQTRLHEDANKLKELPESAKSIENQLLSAQSRLNQYSALFNERMIKNIELKSSSKSQC